MVATPSKLQEPAPNPWVHLGSTTPASRQQQDTWAGKRKETEADRNLIPGWGGSLKNHPSLAHNPPQTEMRQPQPPTFQNPSSDTCSGCSPSNTHSAKGYQTEVQWERPGTHTWPGLRISESEGECLWAKQPRWAPAEADGGASVFPRAPELLGYASNILNGILKGFLKWILSLDTTGTWGHPGAEGLSSIPAPSTRGQEHSQS